LENFTEKSAESIRQDFHSTILIANLETIVTQQADQQLLAKETELAQTVNSAVSFNTIKHKIVDLLYSDIPIDTVLAKMHALFLTNPLTTHRLRPKKTRKTSLSKQLNHYRRKYKTAF